MGVLKVKDRFVGGKEGGSDVLPRSLFRVRSFFFFISYVRFFFLRRFLPVLRFQASSRYVFLYSTSSASSPWSPSISKAAYLLAELNFFSRPSLICRTRGAELGRS